MREWVSWVAFMRCFKWYLDNVGYTCSIYTVELWLHWWIGPFWGGHVAPQASVVFVPLVGPLHRGKCPISIRAHVLWEKSTPSFGAFRLFLFYFNLCCGIIQFLALASGNWKKCTCLVRKSMALMQNLPKYMTFLLPYCMWAP